MKRIALFPGSFDPFTKGHEDIVLRGLRLFDEVVIGIGRNARKERYFPLEQMIKLIEGAFQHHPAVRVMSYEDLTANVAREIGATFLLRGLRNTTDFEYENGISQVNRYVYEDVETVFLITSPNLAPISSSIIRDLHRYGQPVDTFLPYALTSTAVNPVASPTDSPAD
ncbi:pantetheine-phosphate adenylyltransferase [Spirosoma jeollabukense]